MRVLPDGSACFVGIVRDKPFAYPIVVWRNYRTARHLSRIERKPLGHWKSFSWAFSVTPIYFGGYWR